MTMWPAKDVVIPSISWSSLWAVVIYTLLTMAPNGYSGSQDKEMPQPHPMLCHLRILPPFSHLSPTADIRWGLDLVVCVARAVQPR